MDDTKVKIRISGRRKNCGNCKYCYRLITEEPCMDCLYSSKWEPKEEDNNENLNQDTV